MVDPDKEHGKDLFKSWMEELGEMGQLYWKYWTDTWSNDLFDVVKLDSADISRLMKEWDTEAFPVPVWHIEFFQNKIAEKRAELINEHN